MFRIFSLTTLVILGLASSLQATPTPTPTPRKSFLSVLKPRVNPSATVARTGAAVGRSTHLGVDRTAQTPAPKPVAKPKPKSSPAATRTSPKPTATPSKAAKSPTPTPGATTHGTPSPQKEISAEASASPTPSPQMEKLTASPTPMSSPTTTPEPTSTVAATATATPTATPSISPATRPTKTELTLTRFEPPHGTHGDSDYRRAQLSYRISVPSRMEYPTINFTVESSSGKLFERVVRFPSGSTFIDPGDSAEHTVALDTADRDDWAEAYRKSDRATFSWSIEGQSSGRSEMPLKKPWP
ncbi:MAG TPA: hypothetical protein VFA58_08605 [Chthoniobacterales bacterium]|nr:hypothetical protein [Chthoniobacterales bacterium]